MFGLFNAEKTFKRSLAEHRRRINSVTSKIEPAANVEIIEDFLKIHKNALIPVWVFRPEGLAPPYPTLLYIPGTAFIAQEVEVTQAICSQIAKLAKCQVVVVNHRLAPENQFPKGYRDAESVTRYIILENPNSLSIDTDKIMLAGYSSGGNFAAQIALINDLPIRCQILASPLVDLSRSIKDYKEFEAKDEAITEEFVQWFLKFYIPDSISPQDPLLSPYYQKIDKSRKLAPTYLVFGEHDRFLGDAEAYADKLKASDAYFVKEVLKSANHSFLWYKLEAIESIARIIKFTISSHLEYPLSHQQTIIKPTSHKMLIEHISDNDEENSKGLSADKKSTITKSF